MKISWNTFHLKKQNKTEWLLQQNDKVGVWEELLLKE